MEVQQTPWSTLGSGFRHTEPRTGSPLADGENLGHFIKSSWVDTLTTRCSKSSEGRSMAFRLPTVQDEVAGWWEAPLSICSLGHLDFQPHCDFCGTRDYREVWKEGTLVLAKALQCCAEKSGLPPGMLCDIVKDLQRCMEPLMCLKGDDILEALLVKAADNEPRASFTPAEEASLMGEDPTSQEAQETYPLLTTWRRPLSPKVQLG